MQFIDEDGNVDKNSAVKKISEMRRLIRSKTKSEVKRYAQDQYVRCVITAPGSSGSSSSSSFNNQVSASNRFSMDYVIQGLNESVCRETFCFVHGFTVSMIKRISKMLRESETGEINTETIRPWSDSHHHDIDLADTTKVFRDNLGPLGFQGELSGFLCLITTCHQLSFIMLSTGTQMCKAAIMPRADAQMYAMVWLDRYVSVYGDDAPTSDEVHLASPQKKMVYKEYETYFTKVCSPPREIVSYKLFIDLWNGLLPEVLSRGYTEVCGKCDTCYQIHQVRTTAKDSATQLKAKEAHLLHRGGIFMRERYE